MHQHGLNSKLNAGHFQFDGMGRCDKLLGDVEG